MSTSEYRQSCNCVAYVRRIAVERRADSVNRLYCRNNSNFPYTPAPISVKLVLSQTPANTARRWTTLVHHVVCRFKNTGRYIVSSLLRNNSNFEVKKREQTVLLFAKKTFVKRYINSQAQTAKHWWSCLLISR